MILTTPAPPPSSELLTASITVHLTASEKTHAAEAAAAGGLSMSAWGRRAVSDALRHEGA